MAIKVELREGFVHGGELGVLERCRGRTRVRHCRKRRLAEVQARKLAARISICSRTYEQWT